MKKIAFIFPGQGAQYVGMGKDFYESFSIVRETFQEADDRLGFSLTKLMFEGPADELTLTKNSQIAIYVMSVALYRVFTQEFPEMKPSAVAGLSLGEYTALTASGRLSFAEGIDLGDGAVRGVVDRGVAIAQRVDLGNGSQGRVVNARGAVA